MYIHPHWRQFDIPGIPDLHFYLVGIYIGIIGIIGVIGNMLVVFVFCKTKTLRTPPNMFVICLALSDTTFSAVNGFPLFTLSAFQRRWTFGMKTCEIYGLFGGIFGLLSINTMALIALDRYFVIATPFDALKRMTKKRAFIMIVFSCIWSTIWAGLPLFGFGAYIPEGFQSSCTFDYLTRSLSNIIFNIGLYLFGFAFPMMTIIFCYVKIVLAVRQHEREMVKMAKAMNAKDMRSGKDKKSDIQAAKISAVLVALYVLSWGPYATVALMGLIGDSALLGPYVAQIPVLFAKTSAVYNPIVYAISHPKYKIALVKEFPCMACFISVPKKSLSRTDTGGVSGRGGSISQASSETDIVSPGIVQSPSTNTVATTVTQNTELKNIGTPTSASQQDMNQQAEMHM
ncbi:rhodopsin-like [Tubulanus polymorphus]|uniref:rhodopsin-like n=1 Tax=Tubulanus polymorphus TaxID=672921 RepID=UPI003DA67BDC